MTVPISRQSLPDYRFVVEVHYRVGINQRYRILD